MCKPMIGNNLTSSKVIAMTMLCVFQNSEAAKQHRAMCHITYSRITGNGLFFYYEERY